MGSKKVADSGIPFLSSIEGEYQVNLDSAKAAEADAYYNAEQRRKAAKQLMGEQIAAVGASGVEMEGTPMALITEDQKNAEIEAMNIIYAGKVQSTQMKRQASLSKRSGYEGLAMNGLSLAMAGGAFKGSSATTGTGTGMNAASTGTNGYTMSEASSTGGLSNKGIV